MTSDPAAIDAHAHLGSGFRPWRTEDLAADLVATSAEVGIGRSLVSTLGTRSLLDHPGPAELRAANEITTAAIARFPAALAGVVYLSPEHPRASLDELNRHVADGRFVGVKLWIAVRANDIRLDPLVERMCELGVPLLQHAWYKTVGATPGESTPADVAELARRHPDLRIQMAHLGGAGKRGVAEIGPHPNIVVDTSGGDPVLGEVDHAVAQLGAERVIFGSDAPIRDPATALAKVLGTRLGEPERRLVLRENALRVYRRLAAS
ncbi:MAG: amidohydrolase family protein [Actinophytocola sp.]|uniref:amidohydrolase family protein n=1 Tax=Actinophytocola sp. TaxID=1872138 RepID=UPI00132BE910|nr:amidohydrolase family protein [Actinophytocola sp.]MPZ82311.1 amidohydrolase family protein [Actinophytocola sp.]